MDPWIVLRWLIVMAIGLVVVPVALGTYTEYRRPKEVRCPRDGASATIRVEPGIAALTEVIGIRTHCIGSCSLWPERVNCNEECLGRPVGKLPAHA